MELSDKPALSVLLGILVPGYGTEFGGTPFTCLGCPFAGESIEPYALIANDLEEAHYPCSLLKKAVWAETPDCTPGDWKARAKQELGIIGA